MMRAHTAIPSLFMIACAGCTWNQELQDARREATEYRFRVEELEQQLAERGGDTGSTEAQRDRLRIENDRLRKDLAALKERYAALQNQGIIAHRDDGDPDAQTARERQRLADALETLRRSRTEWEQQLAERQRRIEMLTNEVERLKKSLADLRKEASRGSG